MAASLPAAASLASFVFERLRQLKDGLTHACLHYRGAYRKLLGLLGERGQAEISSLEAD